VRQLNRVINRVKYILTSAKLVLEHTGRVWISWFHFLIEYWKL